MKYGVDVRNKRDYVKQQVNFYQNIEMQQNFFRPQVNSYGPSNDRPFYERLYDYGKRGSP